MQRKYKDKSKSKGTFQKKKKHMYYKYTETKLILLLSIIPLYFNALAPAIHKFFNFVRKKIWLRL
jgi:hypothetical protein